MYKLSSMNNFFKISVIGILLSLTPLELSAQNEALKILPNGNVGIGTTNPSEKLDVNGDVKVAGTISGKGSVPIGTIVMWNGDPSKLPPGWKLCDGSGKYTDFSEKIRWIPNLQGRFIVGYSGSGDYNAIAKKGGSGSVTLSTSQMPSHSHTGTTNKDGAHSHTGNERVRSGGFGGGENVIGTRERPQYGGANTAIYSEGSSHKHAFTTNTTRGGGAHENRPPYYTLAYIIRVE